MSDRIDLTEQIDAICDRYDDPHRSDEATREIAALWGNPDCNQFAVIKPTETLSMRLDTHKTWHAEIDLAQTPNGFWMMATSHSYSSGGATSPLSVWDRTAYTNRAAAVSDGVEKLIKAYEGVRDWKGTRSHTEPLLAIQMIKQIAAFKIDGQQMDLF